MTEKRFSDNGFEAIEEQSFTDNLTGKTYYVDYFDEIVDLLNELSDENEQLKQFKEKVFVLLDEKIKHYEHKPISVLVGQPMSVNFDADVDRLARLSELQDLKETLKELKE